MRLLEIGLPYSGRLWYDWRWKFFLTSGSKIQEPLSLSTYTVAFIVIFPVVVINSHC